MNLTLDNIVRSYLFSTSENTLHKYVRSLKFLIDFLRKFSQNHVYMDHLKVLKVDEKYALQLPDDFMSLNYLAYQSGDRIIKFQRDSSINPNVSYCDDAASATPNTAFNISIFECNVESSLFDFINDGDARFRTYGKGYDGIGYFNFNWNNREIQFSSEARVSNGVLISYKSNGFNPRTRSTIPEFAQESAEAFLHWQTAHYDRKLGAAAAETEARRLNYNRVYDDMLAAMDPIDYEALMGIKARATDFRKFAS